MSKSFRTNTLKRSSQIIKKKNSQKKLKTPLTARIPTCYNQTNGQKNQFILGILLLTKKALQLQDNNLLVKGITWLTSELTNGFLFENSKPSIDGRSNNNKKINDTLPIGRLRYQSYNKKQMNNTNPNIHNLNINNNHSQNHYNHSIKPKKPSDFFNKLAPYKILESKANQKLQFHNTYFTTEPNSKEQTLHSASSHTQPLINFVQFSEEVLQTIDKPSFNIFALEEETGSDNTLSVLSSYIFLSHGMYSIISQTKSDLFIRYITKGYDRTNYYHNDLHAADVLHTSMIIMKNSNIADIASFSQLDKCALFLSTIVHDFKHPGLTNNYLIQTSNKIALRYNDSSPLESFHIAEMFKLIKSKGSCDIFSDLTQEDYMLIRKKMIKCVLSTDMIHHSKLVSSIKSLVEKKESSGNENYLYSHYKSLDEKEQVNMQQEYINLLMHTSDISNPAKPFEIYRQWAELVVKEFFIQGDKERNLGLPISYLCDRTKTTVPEAQITFIDYIILPLYTPLSELFQGLRFLLDNINNNKEEFTKLLIKEEKENVNTNL